MKIFILDYFALIFHRQKKFYIENLGFKVKFNDKSEIQSNETKRTILVHTVASNLEIEFMAPMCLEDANRVGKSGGTINLFTIPTHNIDESKKINWRTRHFSLVIQIPHMPVF